MTGTELPSLVGLRARLPRLAIPLSARLLLGAAVADVVVQLFGRGLVGGYLSWSPAVLLNVLSNASYFVLAAALIIGADGWPAGRSLLLAGSVLFAAAGLLNLGLWVWFWVETGGTTIFVDLPNESGLLTARALAEISVAASAALVIAVGLWKSRQSPERASPHRRALLVGATVLALPVVVGNVAVVVAVIALPPRMAPVLEYPFLAAYTAAVALIAIASVAILPRTGRLPEATIALGAIMVVIAKGVFVWLLFIPAGVPQPWIDPALTALDTLGFAGLFVLAAGLAMGRLVAPTAPSPGHSAK